jgi:glycosyltransferase involved in cell wall biosynthesis
MRVLLTGHLSFDAWPLGWWMRDLGGALIQAGHEVRGLVAAGEPAGDDPFPISRVVCRTGDAAADLDFAPPCFAGEGALEQTFDSLSDAQTGRYRDTWRRRLDREVDGFNPHVIHANHLWWDAQLALETGVPYVVSAWNAELTACADRPRGRAPAQQAAENASRIFVPHRALAAAVQATFAIPLDHVAVLPPAMDLNRQTPRASQASRKRVLDRFGLPSDRGPIVVARATRCIDSGLDVLINAAARCQAIAASQSTGQGPLTVIAASACLDPQSSHQAARLGLDRLHLLEIRSDSDWLPLWQAADLAVFPDQQPADGLDVLWALAVGTPAIVTAASGLDWLVNCPAVRTITAGDHELLADAMVESLAGSWKAAQGPAAVEFVRQRHAIAAAAQHVAEVYRRVLAERFGQLPRE